MEDVVQEADLLKHDSFPDPVLPSKAKWRHTVCLICHSEGGALHVFVAVDCAGSPQSRHRNEARRADTNEFRGLWILRAA